MKKTYLFCIAVLAAFVTVSCSKEIINDNDGPQQANLVPMTFSADCEGSKAILVDTESDTQKAVNWKKDDGISVLGSVTGNQLFSASRDGATTTFTGLASLVDTKFYSIYPYQEGLSLADEVVNGVAIPSVQTAVAGSFDPAAFVCAASSTDKAFSFKPLCALLKIKIIDEDASNIKSILIKTNDETAIASEAGQVTFSDAGVSYEVSANVSSVKLLKPEEGFVNNEVYYISIMQNQCVDGVTMYIEYNDGTIYKKSNETALFASENLAGVIRGISVNKANFTQVLSRYELFQAGYDIEIAGKVYNKNSWSDAVKYINTTNTNEIIQYDGMVFIDDSCTARLHSGYNIVVVADKIGGKRVSVSRNKLSFITSKYWVLDHVNLTLSGIEDYAFRLNTKCAYIAINDCSITIPKAKAFIYGDSAKSLDSLKITNSEFLFEANDAAVLFSLGGTTQTMESVLIDNNVFYTADVSNPTTSFALISASGTTIKSFILNANTFYGAWASTGSIVSCKSDNNSVTLNLFGIRSDASSNVFVVGGKINTTMNFKNNAYYKNGAQYNVLTITDGNKASSGENAGITSVGIDLNNWSPADGKFGLHSYYGAKR